MKKLCLIVVSDFLLPSLLFPQIMIYLLYPERVISMPLGLIAGYRSGNSVLIALY